jgi:hypothetical protein
MRCRECSLVWLGNPPSPEEMGDHYGLDYDRAIAGAGEDPNHWSGRRNTLLQYKSGGALLDLGCSSGGFLSSMRSPAWKLYGIEMSDAVAKKAEARCGAEVFVGDILHLRGRASMRSPAFTYLNIFTIRARCWPKWLNG